MSFHDVGVHPDVWHRYLHDAEYHARVELVGRICAWIGRFLAPVVPAPYVVLGGTVIQPPYVIIDGVEFRRSVSARCSNIRRHNSDPEKYPGCACHPTIPQPCPDCYAVEMLTRKVPWSFLGIEPQVGAQAPITPISSAVES